MKKDHPIFLTGAIFGSIFVTIVSIFFFADAMSPVKFGRRPDVWGVTISLALMIYLATVWAVASRRFGRAMLVLHFIFAVLLVGGTALLAFLAFGLLIKAKCGLGAGVGLFGSAAAILLVLGVVPAEIYCLRRRQSG